MGGKALEIVNHLIFPDAVLALGKTVIMSLAQRSWLRGELGVGEQKLLPMVSVEGRRLGPELGPAHSPCGEWKVTESRTQTNLSKEGICLRRKLKSWVLAGHSGV